ncbi:hypothetical protein SLA2020_369390 [Shorea laevis]
MTRLEYLQLSGNQFEGMISPTISNSPSLVILDIRNNHLSGNIPKWLYDLPLLVSVLLSGNRFEGGIPSCIDNITFWKKSSPSSTHSNYFIGKSQLYYLGIPLSLMTGIDMPHSKFFSKLEKRGELGSFPQQVEWGIPYELVGLTSLSTFSVAYNNLSGRVPFEQQFSTFGTQCYDGNSDLCGEPLPRNCSTTNQLEPGHEDEREGTKIIDSPLFFYAFIAVSYAFGFWVFFGILIINKNWREIYFRAVDKFIESCFEMFSKYR